MQLKEPAKDAKLHEIKCYNIQTRGIKYVSYSKTLEKLGVVRNDHSIEIWNLKKSPFLERTIPAKTDSVEAICWAGDRLFSIGLSGKGIKEWDLKTLTVKRKLLLTGDGAICIDYHEGKNLIAVGTEEGIINILDTSYDDLQFHRLLDRQDHRVICCKFDDTGEKLVSGSFDAVKIWNVQTGQVIHKMSTGRSDPSQKTIVWCVEILNDFTIVTGDSRGKVIFWNGEMGSQIDYVHASSVDILCIAASEDRNSFFCSGMEQIVRKFTQVTTKRGGSDVQQWIKSMKKSKLHTHDVMSIAAVNDDMIASGGIDGFLVFSSNDLKSHERCGPFLRRPFAFTSETNRLMLMQYVTYLELWRLASPGNLVDEDEQSSSEDQIFGANSDVLKTLVKLKSNEIYEMERNPEKLIEMHSKNGEMLTSSAISNDGNWLVYSTESTCRLFCLKIQEDDRPILKLMKATPEEFTPFHQVIFSHDSQTFLTFKSDNSFSVFKIYSDGFEHKLTVDVSDYHSDYIHLVELSKCSKYLAISSLCNSTTVWNWQRNKWNLLKTMPKYSHPVTAMKIHPTNPQLVVAFSDARILELNLESQIIESSTNVQAQSCNQSPILSLCFDPRREDAILFQKGDSINVLLKNNNQNSSSRKKTKNEKSDDMKVEVKVAKKYNSHLIHLEFLGEDELITLEVSPVALTENLPIPMRKKQFGAT